MPFTHWQGLRESAGDGAGVPMSESFRKNVEPPLHAFITHM